MEIIKNAKIDWLAKRRVFVTVSLALLLVGVASIASRGFHLGLDFTGGTLVYVKFREEPQLERIRRALSAARLKADEVTRYDALSKNEVQIRTALVESGETGKLALESEEVFLALRDEYDRVQAEAGKVEFNNLSTGGLSARLQEMDPEQVRGQLSIDEFAEHYEEIAGRITRWRNEQGGVLGSFSQLRQISLSEVVLSAIEEKFYPGSFAVISVESVGPKVGRELQKRARDAVLLSLVGMLVYIAIRFRPIYGLAAVVALFHDVLITLGVFSITGKEITLTVVAAILTVVGYSINDTIVIFDRIRENLKLMRRADLGSVINTSINQTLNRTIMTSGLTFLAVFSLYLFGGQVLNGFSLALVLGIIVGTYSTLAIASPIVLWWQNFLQRRKAHA